MTAAAAVLLAIACPVGAGNAFGRFLVKYIGIDVPAQQPPGTYGPYVFRAIDLDAGAQLQKSAPDMDFSLALNVRPLTFFGPLLRESG